MITHAYDVAVIGAGPAGLEAALVLGRQQRSVFLLDSCEYRNAHAQAAHMLVGQEGISPATLRTRTLQSLAELPTVTYMQDKAVGATLEEGSQHIAIRLVSAGTILARRLIIAAGQRDLCDQVPGLSEGFGKYIFHCPYCHGFEAVDKNILVTALPGNPALRPIYQALYLKDRISDSVRLLAPTSSIPQELAVLLTEMDIDVIDGEGASVTRDPSSVTVTTTKGENLHCEAVFATPPTEIGAKQLVSDLALSTRGPCIIIDNHGRTSHAAAFAAGDIAVLNEEEEPLTFVSQAVADGQRAALWADKDLFMETLNNGASAPS